MKKQGLLQQEAQFSEKEFVVASQSLDPLEIIGLSVMMNLVHTHSKLRWSHIFTLTVETLWMMNTSY